MKILDLTIREEFQLPPTIGAFFRESMKKLWIEDEGFSGKRPFGNSDWKHGIYHALYDGGLIRGKTDEEGYLTWWDRKEADKLILSALSAMDAWHK